MKKQEAALIVKGLFKHYPAVQAFYVTTDGQAFMEPQMADSHARQLDAKNPIVTEVTREEAENATDEADDTNKDQVVPYSKMKKPELQAICKEREIAFEEKDTVKELIEKIEAADKDGQ